MRAVIEDAPFGRLSAPTPREHEKWFVLLARSGYAARGIVYLLIGGLSLLSVMGRGGETGDQKDALRAVLAQPGGWVLLAFLALGLLCFVAWRSVQIIVDPANDDAQQNKRKKTFRRIGHAISAIAYASLALAAIKLAWGYGTDSSDATRSWTGWLLQQPLGRTAVVCIGAAFIGTAVAQAVKACKSDFGKRLDLSEDAKNKVVPVCRIGLIARGVCFALIGSFLIYAAWTYDAEQAGGMRSVFEHVSQHAYGSAGVAVLAAGLFSFGVYGIVQAMWQRVV